jgi:hypothetical protein
VENGPPELRRGEVAHTNGGVVNGANGVNGSNGANGAATSTEYPPEAMYPIGAEDHKWKWVWGGSVEGEGVGRVPQALELPEEPLVGYWERVLLGLTAGEVDVWKFAQKEIEAA